MTQNRLVGIVHGVRVVRSDTRRHQRGSVHDNDVKPLDIVDVVNIAQQCREVCDAHGVVRPTVVPSSECLLRVQVQSRHGQPVECCGNRKVPCRRRLAATALDRRHHKSFGNLVGRRHIFGFDFHRCISVGHFGISRSKQPPNMFTPGRIAHERQFHARINSEHSGLIGVRFLPLMAPCQGSRMRILSGVRAFNMLKPALIRQHSVDSSYLVRG